MAWWIAIQPKWRLADDGSFIYSMLAGEDWHSLHKGSSSGLYIIVITLSWWVKTLTLDDSHIHIWTAVHDITWVIDQVYKKVKPMLSRKKRGQEESEQSSNAKRFITIKLSIHCNIR